MARGAPPREVEVRVSASQRVLSGRSARHRPTLRACVGLFVLSMLWGGCQPPPEPTLADAQSALADGDYSRAEEAASRIPEESPDKTSALAVAGEAALKAGRVDAALRHYQDLAARQKTAGETPFGLFYAGETLRDAGRLFDAEQQFREFLSVAPNHALSHERLAFLASVSGRRWESVPHYFALLRTGKPVVGELVLLADLDRPIEQRPFLEECEQKSPGDRLVAMGLAAHAFWEGAPDARERLGQIVSAWPESTPHQAMLGDLLVHQESQAFLEWHARLPQAAEDDPDIWYVRGLWARRNSQLESAARCFWEALRRAPVNRRATFQLAQVFQVLGREDAEVVAARSRDLMQLSPLLDDLLRHEARDPEAYRRIAELMQRMGRIWEAGAWGIAARNAFPKAAWTQPFLEGVAKQLTDTLPLVADTENLALQFDLSSYPEFAVGQSGSRTPHPVARKTLVRFREALDGPAFAYHNGGDPATPGARMFEQTGGGVAVIDLDGDFRPDLFFPQGGAWPTGQTEPAPPGEFTDRLFRNVGEQSRDVTLAAGLIDRGFGQGAAVGDFDNDGFPDLYVANVGRNQLLHNRGDGTFEDLTDQAGLTADDWTASCAVVDLNADGLPDLYDVNYLTGPRVYEIICDGKSCSPIAFPGAPDRLWLNRGDGTFELRPPERPEVDGKGLGVVAFVGEDRLRPALFIANDQVPNFLLRNRGAGSGDVRLENEAFISGVAFNQDGLAMASMGIAADDADGNGWIDFHVTTFKDEASLLLLQDASGQFLDGASAAGLRGPTWPYVGWGSQFLDADLDGHPDLVAVNGHVDDYRDRGGQYQMPPQFFRNAGGGRFEDASKQSGKFFAELRLGRGLSRLDWNQDGRMDFAVSNIGDQVSLVLNDTPDAGHFLSVRLIAVQSARDAIGSEVEVRAGEVTWRKQLVAGDGYMASNERLLQFGLGAATRVSELRVRWPSGASTVVKDVPSDGTLQLVETSGQALLRHSSGESTVVDVAPRQD